MLPICRVPLILLCLLFYAGNLWGEDLKVHIAPFSVTGAANKDEIRPAIQALLMTRMSSDNIQTIENSDGADVIVTGSYIAFGKIFSIDATAKSRSGSALVRAFEQGESQDDILSVVGKVAGSLKAGISKRLLQPAAIAGTPAAVGAQILPAAASATAGSGSAIVVAGSGAIVKPQNIESTGDLVKAEPVSKSSASGWVSQKIDGEQTGLASGRNLGEKGREIFIAGRHSLKYFLLGSELRLQAEAVLPVNLTVVAVDTADLDGDGNVEIYLTVFNGEDLASQVWIAEGTALKMVSEKLPYLFRAVTVQAKKVLYAQQLDRYNGYYGDLLTVVKKGAGYDFINPVKLPRGLNIHNGRVIHLGKMKTGFVGINQDGYLLVFDDNQAEIWRSSDKYGGSETFFIKNNPQDYSVSGLSARKVFVEQRIVQAASGHLIVPKNDGTFVVGDSRSYKKNSVFSFSWNNVSLDENWHTKLSQNYLLDYIYDEEGKELLLLEIVKKEGIFDKGASALFIKKVE